MHNTAETHDGNLAEQWRNRRKGRGAQTMIYTGKLLRMFVYQTDWKVLPMSAIIAALVSMVIRKDFFLTMEGNLKGAFAVTCVSIWNGCFNSIQVICRERNVLKREHRAGLHISSYIFSHMIYQALLCVAQTVITLVVFRMMKVQMPREGLITDWLVVDMGITIFLMSYASDMLSLFVSSLAHTTTTAMTIMPFVLIFQLVFSGGIFNLPAWSQGLANYTISNYGLKCVAAHADYNNSPMVTAWNTLLKLKDHEVGGTVTVGQILDFLSDKDNTLVNELRDREINATTTVGEVWNALSSSATYQDFTGKEVDASFTLGEILELLRTSDALKDFRDTDILGATTVGKLLDELNESLKGTEMMDYSVGRTFTIGELLQALHADELMEKLKDFQIGGKITVGELIDMITQNKDLQARRDQGITVKTTVERIIQMLGEDNVKDLAMNKTARASRVPAYDRTPENIRGYWTMFGLFIFVFAAMAMISLEFIDKDKR